MYVAHFVFYRGDWLKPELLSFFRPCFPNRPVFRTDSSICSVESSYCFFHNDQKSNEITAIPRHAGKARNTVCGPQASLIWKLGLEQPPNSILKTTVLTNMRCIIKSNITHTVLKKCRFKREISKISYIEWMNSRGANIHFKFQLVLSPILCINSTFEWHIWVNKKWLGSGLVYSSFCVEYWLDVVPYDTYNTRPTIHNRWKIIAINLPVVDEIPTSLVWCTNFLSLIDGSGKEKRHQDFAFEPRQTKCYWLPCQFDAFRQNDDKGVTVMVFSRFSLRIPQVNDTNEVSRASSVQYATFSDLKMLLFFATV